MALGGLLVSGYLDPRCAAVCVFIVLYFCVDLMPFPSDPNIVFDRFNCRSCTPAKLGILYVPPRPGNENKNRNILHDVPADHEYHPVSGSYKLA